MPLLIQGCPITQVPNSVLDLVKKHPHIQDDAKCFREKSSCVIGPEELLYICQREYAVVTPHDKNIHILGTQDATTCHMVVLRHTASGVCCLSHCDGCDTLGIVNSMVDTVQRLSRGGPEGTLELCLVGGFMDDGNSSQDLTQELLGAFMSQPVPIQLRLACITELNDVIKGDTHFPIVYGIGVDVATGEVFPASFPDHGPENEARAANNFAGCDKFQNIYDCEEECLVIGPYFWKAQSGVRSWLSAPDFIIRKHLSTSPKQEPAHFEAHVRAALQTLCDHPKPDVTLFPGGQSRRYKKCASGKWKLVDMPS